MNIDKLKQELEKKEEIIDALSTAVKVNKDAVKKLKAENEKLKAQQKLEDDLQKRTQSEYEKLKVQLAEALFKLQWCSCQHTAADKGSDSASTYDRHRDIHLVSDSYRSFMNSQERQDVCDLGSQPSEECARHRDIQFGSESYRSFMNSQERQGVFELGSQPSAERDRTFKYAIMPRSDKLRKASLVVVAIHIGASFSGFAYSFKYSFKRDPKDIMAHTWSNDDSIYHKTTTAILIDENKEFVNFGYQAEDKYNDLQLDDEHRKYFFFKDFTRPFNRVASVSGFDENMMIEDDFNKKIRVITILSMSIKYMADLFYSLFKKTDLAIDDINWVLTIPPSTTIGLQKCMQRAAEKAGIELNKLILVLDPIAVYAYFRYSGNTGKSKATVQEPTKYMVMDIGGTTMNVSIIDVGNTGNIIGCSWTSDDTCDRVDEKMFEQFIVNILGRDVYDKFRKDYPDDYTYLLKQFDENTQW